MSREDERQAALRLHDAAEDLLDACRRSLALLLFRLDMAEICDEEKRHIDTLRAVIRRAE